jgi:transcriptional regulator with XRE-family HTH domain
MVETLGSRLRQLRESKHFKQEQIARLLNVNKTTVSYYENNIRQPSYSTLIRIASIFNVSTDYLLGCQRNLVIDVSALNDSDLELVRNLVESLGEKNKSTGEK